MDHHCPWVNNCGELGPRFHPPTSPASHAVLRCAVGTNNLKHFLLFLLWVGVGAVYAFTLTAWRLFYCWWVANGQSVPLGRQRFALKIHPEPL
jgi:hypothetical protein